jgi:hypothetical protein
MGLKSASRSLVLAAALTAMMAFPAPAQLVDTRPNVLVLCLDPAGNRPGICQIFTPQTAYLMILNPTDGTGLSSFGASFALPPGLASGGFVPAAGVIDGSVFPVLDLSFTVPLPPVGDTYTLGRWTVMVTSPAEGIVSLTDHFPIHPYRAAYVGAGSTTPIALTPPDWGNGMPMGDPWASAVLWLNNPVFCGFVTPEEATEWGAVKAMFR